MIQVKFNILKNNEVVASDSAMVQMDNDIGKFEANIFAAKRELLTKHGGHVARVAGFVAK